MKAPQIVCLDFDGWITKQLKDLSAESRWLLREVRQNGACLALLEDLRPTVLFVQIDPHRDPPEGFKLISEVARTYPDVAIAVVSDGKLPEEDRISWTATALDLGARYVLFPPLTRPVFEDIATGLMASILARITGLATKLKTDDDVIDLAEENAL